MDAHPPITRVVTDEGLIVDELVDPVWQAVMGVLNAAYDLGMSGDPAETTDPEQINRRLALVDACEEADTEIRFALVAAFDRAKENA